MIFREIMESDVDELFIVRAATRENALSAEQLSGLGITKSSVKDSLNRMHRGWLCQDQDRIVGFAMGDRSTGEMWVLAVLPEYEGRGIGSQLLDRVEKWLWSAGWDRIWLTTDIDPSRRAYGFYLHEQWKDWKIEDGNRYMIKEKNSQFFPHVNSTFC